MEEKLSFSTLNRHGIMIIRVISVAANGLKAQQELAEKSAAKMEHFLLWKPFQNFCHCLTYLSVFSWSGPSI
jgi:hypothetical protein